MLFPPPKGKQWSPRQVQIIYENEAYTGCTFNNQIYSGRYFRRDRVLGFVALDRNACQMVKNKTFAPKLRPMDEWDRIDQPHMYDFLPKDVRDLAIEAQVRLALEMTSPNRPKRPPSAHPASLFFFSGKLTMVQDGAVVTAGELVGTMSGPRGHKTPALGRNPSHQHDFGEWAT